MHTMPVLRRLAPIAATLALATTVACGSDSGTSNDDDATLIDASINLVAGASCDEDAVAREFTAVIGGRVTVTVTGPANRNVQVVLYAPDYTTQLGGAQSAQGTARFVATATAAGTHYVNVCEVDGLAATVRLVVTQAIL